MAGLDKTYVNKEQYKQLRKFWIETRAEQTRLFGCPQYLFPFYAFGDVEFPEGITDELLSSGKDINDFPDETTTKCPLWNTGSDFDAWLSKICPLDFIQNRLKEQYGDNWFAFKYADKLDFSSKPFLVSIHYTDNNFNPGTDSLIYFFRDKGDDIKEKGDIFVHDKIIFYGTTFLFHVIDLAYRSITQMGYLFNRPGLIVEFDYFGIAVTCKNGTCYLGETDEVLNLNIMYDSVFHKPEIKHSYDLKESDGYRDEEIFISSENECWDLTQIKLNEGKKPERSFLLKRSMLFIPDYMQQLIK